MNSYRKYRDELGLHMERELIEEFLSSGTVFFFEYCFVVCTKGNYPPIQGVGGQDPNCVHAVDGF